MQIQNITSATTTVLKTRGGVRDGAISAIKLTNAHASTAVTVSIYLQKADNSKFYIAHQDVNGKTSVTLDKNLAYNSIEFQLAITTTSAGLGASTPLTVIIV